MKLTFRRVRETKNYSVYEQEDTIPSGVVTVMRNKMYLPKGVTADEFTIVVPEVDHARTTA